MTDFPKQDSREEYISRVNRVVDYIEKNIRKTLTLDELANIAHFSKFHFHRIFKAFIGETIAQFIQRIRIERAAKELISNPRKSITEIAFDNGFSDPAIFSRSFKNTYQKNPSQWRNGGYTDYNKNRQTHSKINQTESNFEQDFRLPPFYIDSETNNQVWRIKMDNFKDVHIEVKEMPEMYVAYLRHTGPYKGNGTLFEKLLNQLVKWAGPRNLLHFPKTKLMSVYHDDPEITDDDKLRLSVCLTVDRNTPVDGEIGKMTLTAGKFAVGSFEISGSGGYEQAWNMMMAGWLPESGYQPDDRLCYEIYKNDPNSHPEGKHLVDICVPIKPL